MKYSTLVTHFAAGIVGSLLLQYVSFFLFGLLPIDIFRLDPAVNFLYSTLGIVVTVASALFAFKKQRRAVALGLIAGILLWWPFLVLWMSLTGTWL